VLSDELRDLYQEVILDHQANPRNFREMASATHSAEGFNTLCGDQVSLFLQLDGDKIADASFQGSGCAISTASASLMTELLRGKSLKEAEQLFVAFHEMATGSGDGGDRSEENDEQRLDKLRVLSGVREFPGRVKCATLPWHTFHAAIENKNELVSTE
jgi:nitrogen fixation NifU-like protein